MGLMIKMYFYIWEMILNDYRNLEFMKFSLDVKVCDLYDHSNCDLYYGI